LRSVTKQFSHITVGSAGKISFIYSALLTEIGVFCYSWLLLRFWGTTGSLTWAHSNESLLFTDL